MRRNQSHRRTQTDLFTPECEHCLELLVDYIAAANATIDIEGRSGVGTETLTQEIEITQHRRYVARKLLLTHKHQEHYDLRHGRTA